ncbi:hypothetical protein HK101_003995 [Irineochytrium annulatum]|nr:hypothetical protein HK101_003995 [Irineochytrium annulatum]
MSSSPLSRVMLIHQTEPSAEMRRLQRSNSLPVVEPTASAAWAAPDPLPSTRTASLEDWLDMEKKLISGAPNTFSFAAASPNGFAAAAHASPIVVPSSAIEPGLLDTNVHQNLEPIPVPPTTSTTPFHVPASPAFGGPVLLPPSPPAPVRPDAMSPHRRRLSHPSLILQPALHHYHTSHPYSPSPLSSPNLRHGSPTVSSPATQGVAAWRRIQSHPSMRASVGQQRASAGSGPFDQSLDALLADMAAGRQTPDTDSAASASTTGP